MGGCRCSFRQCHVRTSKFPGMHFFHFPLKEPERLKKWIQYAKLGQMLHYTETRKKNTVICARHFRVEYFMNYKMEKLGPSAIPTLLRLSKDQALDFELDIEKGVLVTLEQTKLNHLIPPEGFESPLYLENDKILMDLLNEVQQQSKNPNVVGDVEYIRTCDEVGELILEEPMKSSSNTVEILETIQFSAPFKRSREYSIDEFATRTIDNVKKFKILNSAHCSMAKENKSETTLLLTSRPDENDSNYVISDNIEFVECNNTQKQGEDLFTNERYECNDEELEFFNIQKADNESLNGSETPNSDSTIVQLKAGSQAVADSVKQQLVAAQHEIFNLKKQNEEIPHLRSKICLLENENCLLKGNSKEFNELREKLFTLENKNNQMEKILKEQKFLQEKIAKYSAENKKLKTANDSIAVLEAKLLSKTQETEKLKKIVDSLDSRNLNDDKLRMKIETEKQIKEELISLRNKTENMQKELLIAESQLRNVEADLITTRNEKDNLQQKYSDLEQKYCKLKALQNSEVTVSTSVDSSTITKSTAPTTFAASLTKAQLFNGIKRYLSSAMVSLLRMEMFGSSEREWKPDERQIAVDILRLGETVYKYFIDEWRFRLPALREANNWLSQSVQMYDEEDL